MLHTAKLALKIGYCSITSTAIPYYFQHSFDICRGIAEHACSEPVEGSTKLAFRALSSQALGVLGGAGRTQKKTDARFRFNFDVRCLLPFPH
jgi:hypothetical protein